MDKYLQFVINKIGMDLDDVRHTNYSSIVKCDVVKRLKEVFTALGSSTDYSKKLLRSDKRNAIFQFCWNKSLPFFHWEKKLFTVKTLRHTVYMSKSSCCPDRKWNSE